MRAKISSMQSLNVGDARVSIFNVGDLNFKLSEAVNAPESEQRDYFGDLHRINQVPCQSVLISMPNFNVLVDPGDHARFLRSSPEYGIPNEKLRPSLVDQLSEMKVSCELVNYVVVTHTHFDHYAGVTTTNGEIFPTFPNARVISSVERISRTLRCRRPCWILTRTRAKLSAFC